MTGPVQRRRRDSVIAVAVVAAVSLLLLGVPLLFGQVYYGLDLTYLDLATDCALRQLMAEGDLHWLSRQLGNGAPLLTRPSAQAFYPLRWLLLWLFDTELAVSVAAVTHLTLLATGTVVLARSFALRPTSAMVAGLVMAFSGTGLNLLVHTNNFLTGAASLPWIWAGARLALRRRGGTRGLLICWLALEAALLGGEPQSFLVGAGLVLLEALRAPQFVRRERRGQMLTLLALLPLSFVTGLPLWGGFLAEASLTPRGTALDLHEALRWSFGPSQWLASLWPRPGGSALSPTWDLWQGITSDPALARTWNPAPYLGPLFLALLAWGATLRRARWPLGIAGLTLLFALGAHGPLLPWLLQLVEPLARFRYPQKYLVPATLAAVLVVALAVEQLARQRARRRTFALLASVVLVAQLLAWVLFFIAAEDFDTSILHHRESWPTVLTNSPAAQIRAGILRSSLPLAVVLAALAAPQRWRRWLGAVLVLEMLLAVPGSLYTGPRLLDLPSPAAPLAHKDDRSFAVLCVHENLRYYRYMLPGVPPQWASIAFQRVYDVPELQACDGIVAPIPYSPVQSSVNKALAERFFEGDISAARALGSTHLLLPQRQSHPDLVPVALPARSPRIAAMLATGPTLHQLQDPVPEVFVVAHPKLVPSDATLPARLVQTTSARELLALVDDPLGRLPADPALPAGREVRVAAVHWPQREQAEVELEGSGGALVGLRTVYLRGWQARQAGRALPVLRVGGQHLAAWVEDSGAGPVQFRYRSPGIALNLSLAIIASMLTLGLLGWRFRQASGRTRRSE